MLHFVVNWSRFNELLECYNIKIAFSCKEYRRKGNFQYF